MKLRIRKTDHARLGAVGDALGLVTGEVVRRCIHKWCAGGVATSQNNELATSDSTVITLDDTFQAWTPGEIRSAVKHGMDSVSMARVVPLKIDPRDAAEAERTGIVIVQGE